MSRKIEPVIALLSLSDALGETVRVMETEAGVPPGEQLGFSHLFGVGEPPAKAPAATGPNYVRLFTSAPMPKRGCGISLPQPPRVPALPDRNQLEALLKDQDDAADQTSAAERRLVRCHLALMHWLESGRLRAWGNLTVHGSSGRVADGGRQEIAPDWWSDASLDYLGQPGLAPWWQPGASAWRDGATYTIGTTEVSGPGGYSQITVDHSVLSQLMAQLARGQVVFQLERPAKGAREVWIVRSGEAHFEIEADDEEVLIRGLRSLAVLLSNPNRAVPFHLLAAMARKDINTRPSEDPKQKALHNFKSEFRVGTDAIADTLFGDLARLDEATRRLVDHLHLTASQAAAKLSAPLIRDFGKDVEMIADAIGGRQGGVPKSMSRVGEVARTAIRKALDSMDQAGQGSLPKLGTALLQRLPLAEARYTLTYTPDFLDPTWNVV